MIFCNKDRKYISEEIIKPRVHVAVAAIFKNNFSCISNNNQGLLLLPLFLEFSLNYVTLRECWRALFQGTPPHLLCDMSDSHQYS